MPVTTYRYAGPGMLTAEDRNGTQSAYQFDAWGSTAQMVNSSGTVTDTFRFDSYGNEVERTGTTPTIMQWVASAVFSTLPSRFYLSSVFDPEIGVWTTVGESGQLWLGGALSMPPMDSHDHWLTVAYNAPYFFRCYMLGIQGKQWTPELAYKVCAECKKSMLIEERRHVPKQCRDFLASNPPKLRRESHTPQTVNYSPPFSPEARGNKPWYRTGSVRNESKCIVRICWKEPDGTVHCWDLLPDEQSDPWIDVDVVCYCGKPYKIGDFNLICVNENLLFPEPSGTGAALQKIGSPPIYRAEEVPDKDWFKFEEACKEAMKYITGDCCTDPKVKYSL